MVWLAKLFLLTVTFVPQDAPISIFTRFIGSWWAGLVLLLESIEIIVLVSFPTRKQVRIIRVRQKILNNLFLSD